MFFLHYFPILRSSHAVCVQFNFVLNNIFFFKFTEKSNKTCYYILFSHENVSNRFLLIEFAGLVLYCLNHISFTCILLFALSRPSPVLSPRTFQFFLPIKKLFFFYFCAFENCILCYIRHSVHIGGTHREVCTFCKRQNIPFFTSINRSVLCIHRYTCTI